MDFEMELLNTIIKNAKKLEQRFQDYHNKLPEILRRDAARTGIAEIKEIKLPSEWNDNDKFNPFYVRRHAKAIAKSISKKIFAGTYEPYPPVKKQIPKAGGGTREISIYQIPDSAVSLLLFRILNTKNQHRFSNYSYAYREGKNPHFAIQDIFLDIEQYNKIFICEYDFRKFFDSIPHDYLFKQLGSNGFSVSKTEEKLIRTFIANPENTGIPQGTSISLFLANVACWRMDRALESEGIRFARYADDTIIWSQSYEKILKSHQIIHNFSKDTGININFKKSEGISQLVHPEVPSEFSTAKTSFNFLGYKISLESISIREKSIAKIKKQISYILYKNLIKPLLQNNLTGITIPSNNQDPALRTSIRQIRRYLYGNLNEISLLKYKSNQKMSLQFKGLMSYYPILTNIPQLIELDGWLISTIHKTLRVRKKLLNKHGFRNTNQYPFICTKEQLLQKSKYKKDFKDRSYRIPSFLRIFNTIKLGIENHGISGMFQESNIYHYS